MDAVTLLPIVSYNRIRPHTINKRFWYLAPNANIVFQMVGTGGSGTKKQYWRNIVGVRDHSYWTKNIVHDLLEGILVKIK